MSRRRTSTKAHVCGAAVVASIAALALSTGPAPGASGASASPPDPSGTVRGGSSGEDETGGPLTAPVPPDHATPQAARAAALAAHQHHHTSALAPRTSAARTGAKTSAVAAAALDPAVFGQWSTLSSKLPLRAVHATLLRTGKFLLIAGSGNVASDHTIGNFKAYLWDPGTNALTSVPVPYDAFCSGHVVDANGDVLVFGGTAGYKSVVGAWQGS
ncbi:MAG: hypothetical protein JWP24_105, partial [Marmoricola sp.]|nr:hypothetical protein [Marmoricola sp.]